MRGLAESDYLLVIKDCASAVSNLFAFNNLRNRKLNVFCEEMVNPASTLFNQIRMYQKSCTGNGATGVKNHSRKVEKFSFMQEPKCITCRNPVLLIVLGVSITRDYLV